MKLDFRKRIPAAFALAAVVVVSACSKADPPQPAANVDWQVYGSDRRNTKYTSLGEITAENAKNLQIAWRWSSPDNAIAKDRGLHPNLFEGTPVMVGGNLYIATGLNQAASIDAATGKTRWVYDPGIYERGAPQRNGFVHRGVTVWSEGARVFLATGEGYLIALDMESGKPVADFGKDGVVDLTEGLRRPVARFEFGVSSPPIVVSGVLVVGSFVQDGWLKKQAPPGDVRGYDPRTGKLLWTFHTIPEAGEPGVETWLEDSSKFTGAANVWAVMSGDDALGRVYLPTSTPTNDHYGGHRPGDNLYAESIVCLDAATGKRIWHFQTTHHGVWDYDLPAPPVLADVTIGGKIRKILAQPSKQAFVYVLDRETGEPIWPISEQAVPASSVPGERSATTQPFPTTPAAFDRQGLRLDDLIDFTPELREEAERIVKQYDFGPLYTPPSERGAVVLPGAVGGASWAGAALDPESGWLYVPSITNPMVMRTAKPKAGESDMRYVVLGPDRFVLSGPEGLPITKPPYGRITAIDLATGNHQWMTPLGSGPRNHPKLKDLNLPELGWPSRGFLLVTRTLLFAAQEPVVSTKLDPKSNVSNRSVTTREPSLRTFDKRTGKAVAETALPTNATGSPISYGVRGRQFVVVPVGGGGVPAELVALALESPQP